MVCNIKYMYIVYLIFSILKVSIVHFFNKLQNYLEIFHPKNFWINFVKCRNDICYNNELFVTVFSTSFACYVHSCKVYIFYVHYHVNYPWVRDNSPNWQTCVSQWKVMKIWCFNYLLFLYVAWNRQTEINQKSEIFYWFEIHK